MSTILYTVVTTLTLTVNMKMPIDSNRSWPMNGTATTQVHSVQQFAAPDACGPKSKKLMADYVKEVEGTKVAKVISINCI
jgi:hypothetical protein